MNNGIIVKNHIGIWTFALIVIILSLLCHVPSSAEGSVSSIHSTLEYDDITELGDSALRVRIGGKYGLISTNGTLLIPPEWDWIECCQYKSDQEDYDPIEQHLYGMYIVTLDGKKGLVRGYAGSYITKAEWDDIGYFYGIYTIVKKDGKYGVINRNGDIIIPPEYDHVYIDNDCLFYVCLHEKEGVFYPSGNLLTPIMWDDVRSFEGDCALVQLDDQYGLIDRHGNIVIEPIWEEISNWDKIRAFVRKNELWGIVELYSGRVLKEPSMGALDILSAGYTFTSGFIVSRIGAEDSVTDEEELYGYVNDDFEWVIEPKFSMAYDFDTDYAIVIDASSQKYGIIDNSGDYVIAPNYSFIMHDCDQYYYFWEDMGSDDSIEPSDYKGLINAQTGVIMDAKWSDIGVTATGNIYASRDEIGYLFDESGEMIAQWPTSD